jgi:predicted metalloprotease
MAALRERAIPPLIGWMSKGRIACWALWLSACSWTGGSFDRPEPEPPRTGRAHAAGAPASDADLEAFAARVVKDADQSWAADFKRRNKPYTSARATFSEPAVAPCAAKQGADAKCEDAQAVYIDLDFQRLLQERYGKEAVASQSYAIAHAMGHHVQKVLGLDREAARLVAGRPVAAHSVQLQLELQADCLAGVWTRATKSKDLLDREHVEEALKQASDVGTERRIAQEKEQRAMSESFTYAIPRRRLYWFAKGFNSARIEDCDTFDSESQ